MKIGGERHGIESLLPRATFTHLARLAVLAVTLTAAILSLTVLPQWLVVITPRWLVRTGAIVFLWTLLGVFLAAVPAVMVCGVLSFLGAVRGYRRGNRQRLQRNARRLLLVASGLLGLITMELGSAARLRVLARLPVLPTRFVTPATSASSKLEAGNLQTNDQASRDSDSRPADGLYIVVAGESSAQGVPYHPWVSVGQIVGWQLEQVFPGRPVEVDIRADGGFCLEQAVDRLRTLERRPDAMIVFSGHNEFQTRFGWSRNVAHYVEEGANSWLGTIDRARSISAACKLILTTLDLYYGESAPTRATRELVDHPTCSSSEYDFLRDDFQLRLDALTAYCRRIGCLPILIVPASNDGSFEPSRSVLHSSMPPEDRAAFAREFEAVRARESVDAAASIAAYGRLVKAHPEFAETHYRLGRLLAASGAWSEAKEHFVLARDLDGLPLRCPTDFREACRTAARRHDAMLVDGPVVLSRLSPHGVLDDHLYHDAHHPNLAGIVALANDMLVQLRERRAFGWPAATPAPRVEPEDCVRHFALDAQKWAEVCVRSSSFYGRTAFTRYDPSARLEVKEQYLQASQDLFAGRPVRDRSNPSIVIAESLLRAMRQPSTPAGP